MEILNTETVPINIAASAFFVGLVTLGIILVLIGISEMSSKKPDRSKYWQVCCIGIIFTAFGVFALNDMREVKQYEVILEPDYVIDATKYKIIEQRGEIYVIMELEPSKDSQ